MKYFNNKINLIQKETSLFHTVFSLLIFIQSFVIFRILRIFFEYTLIETFAMLPICIFAALFFVVKDSLFAPSLIISSIFFTFFIGFIYLGFKASIDLTTEELIVHSIIRLMAGVGIFALIVFVAWLAAFDEEQRKVFTREYLIQFIKINNKEKELSLQDFAFINNLDYKFTTMDLSNLDFSRMDLSYIDFSSSDLSNTKFIGSNLSNSRFIGSNLTNTNFTNANLSGAKF